VLGSLKDMAGKAFDVLPLAEAIAKMSDEDCNYVLGTCLNVVSRQIDGGRGWAKVWSEAAKKPMYDDIDMGAMIAIVVRVLQDALAPFFAALPRTSSGEQAALSTSQ
jgi:hypothetical protein